MYQKSPKFHFLLRILFILQDHIRPYGMDGISRFCELPDNRRGAPRIFPKLGSRILSKSAQTGMLAVSKATNIRDTIECIELKIFSLQQAPHSLNKRALRNISWKAFSTTSYFTPIIAFLPTKRTCVPFLIFFCCRR